MKLAILKERRAGEARVAATPESVKKLKGLGLDVLVEAGAGAGARISDTDYEAAGAVVTPDAAQMLADADIVLSVRGPSDADIAKLKKGAVLAACWRRIPKKTRSQSWPRRASPPLRWNSSRASRAPRRWTCCRPRPISPATRR